MQALMSNHPNTRKIIKVKPSPTSLLPKFVKMKDTDAHKCNQPIKLNQRGKPDSKAPF